MSMASDDITTFIGIQYVSQLIVRVLSALGKLDCGEEVHQEMSMVRKLR